PQGDSFASPGEAAKKNPGYKPGWEAFLLSHIKAPAQGGKAGSGKPPIRNLTNRGSGFKAVVGFWPIQLR
ncbi:MAG: hypothetical protein JWP43_2696, partial [Ramlibacter sp.]|nr:hypothetical protein [Ramlibacter sp.]